MKTKIVILVSGIFLMSMVSFSAIPGGYAFKDTRYLPKKIKTSQTIPQKTGSKNIFANFIDCLFNPKTAGAGGIGAAPVASEQVPTGAVDEIGNHSYIGEWDL